MQDNHKNNLKMAEESIFKVKEAVKAAPSRQRYHFMPPAYWMNDPNGLIYFNNKYHIFYQFNPYAPEWGAMHWGHATSKDLLHWEHQPIALAPSEKYDLHENGGCFSGSAVDNNGTLSLMYTGSTMVGEEYIQTQCLATSSDAIHFEKYKNNPVAKRPKWLSSTDFRDPKVWKHEDTWYMVVGAKDNDKGKALLYRSSDLINWEFFNVLAESRGELGHMWECPDFFEIDGKYVLFISPIGVQDRKTVYLIGDMDYKTGKFDYHSIGEIDWGFDFYAPQTMLDDKGRRIVIGWANSWDWMPWWKGFGTTYKDNWCGAFSIPRVVELVESARLKFSPIEELKTLRTDAMEYSQKTISKDNDLYIKVGDGISYELIIDIDLSKTTASAIEVDLKNSVIECDLNKGEIEFIRDRDDFIRESRRCTLKSAGKDKLKLHIFSDTCSIEVFTDDGQTVMSNNISPVDNAEDILIRSKSGSTYITSINTWGLKSVW